MTMSILLKKISALGLFLLLLSSTFAVEEANVRPHPEGVPTPVEIGIYVIDIETIDNLKQHFVADFMLFVRWKDERLKGEMRTIEINDIWWPNVTILNGRDLSMKFPHRVEVDMLVMFCTANDFMETWLPHWI